MYYYVSNNSTPYWEAGPVADSFAFDVFLSHNRAQKDWTEDLARRLRDDGFKVWFDKWELPQYGGKDWIEQLAIGVKESRKIVLVWSPEFFANEWPVVESRIIQQLDPIGRQGRVIPLLHTPVEVPEEWGFRQALDFTFSNVGPVEFDFCFQQLAYNLDNSRPYEGDLQEFRKHHRVGATEKKQSTFARTLTTHGQPAQQQQLDVILSSLEDSKQHVEGSPGWEAAYLELPIWSQFPVLAFCGRTTLSDAISSDMVKGPSPAILGRITGESETMTLSSVRYSGKQALTPALPFVDNLAASHRKIVLFGDAGDGKTTLLRLMARQFCAKGMFPILIRAREWEESKSSIREFIQDGGYFRSETLGRPSSPALSQAGKALWACIEAGRAPILVDGLDEAAHAESVGTALRDLPGDPIVIVTTRRAQYRNALPEFERFELHPFDYDGQVRPYVHVRLGVDARAFLERLESDARVRALTGNGLMLAMLCTRWEQIRFDSRNEFDLPVARDELYAWATDYLLDEPEGVGRTRHVPFCQNKPLKHSILSAIAFHGHICGGRTLDIPSRTVARSTEEVAKPFEHIQESPNALEDIVQNSELLTQASTRRSFRFFHPSFQEFYAARHLAIAWKSDELSDWFPRMAGIGVGVPVLRCACCRSNLAPFKELFSHQEYHETLLLLAGLVDDEDREGVLLATFQDMNLRLMILSRCRNVHTSVIEACLDSVKRGMVPSSDALRAMSSIRSHENMQAILTGLGTLLGCGEVISMEAASIVLYEVSLLDRDGEILAQLEGMLQEPTLRTVAARVLEKVGPNGATAGILARLLDLLDTSEWDDYLVFVRAICSLTGRNDFESALSALSVHEDNMVRLSTKTAQCLHDGEAATVEATELLKSGDLSAAIEKLRHLLEIGFDLPRTRCHLARALVLNSDHCTARSQIDAAWNERDLAEPYVRARIIWFKIAFVLLDRNDASELIDELRLILQDKRSHRQWEINECLAQISSNGKHRDTLAALAREIQQNPGG